jgi:hypothetical protein
MKFGPELPQPAVFDKGHDCRDFLLTKGLKLKITTNLVSDKWPVSYVAAS